MDETVRPVKKNRAVDIVLKLAPVDGKAPLSSTGLIDKRLFTGDNRLHAIYDHQTHLWYLKYDDGIVPDPLKQRFTGLQKMLDFVTGYFARRNIKIEEIID